MKIKFMQLPSRFHFFDPQLVDSGVVELKLIRDFFFRPTPYGSRQVVYQAGKPVACKFTELMQWQHAYCLLPIVHAFHGSKVDVGKKLQQWQRQGLRPLAVALIGVDQLPPLWTHHDDRQCASKRRTE